MTYLACRHRRLGIALWLKQQQFALGFLRFEIGKSFAMSNVNVSRAVENIRANTTIYTAIVEVVVNAIQAIDEKAITKSRQVHRA